MKAVKKHLLPQDIISVLASCIQVSIKYNSCPAILNISFGSLITFIYYIYIADADVKFSLFNPYYKNCVI